MRRSASAPMSCISTCGSLNVRLLWPYSVAMADLMRLSEIPALSAMEPHNDIVFLGSSRYAHLRSICLARH
jgi:hypothetical protein